MDVGQERRRTLASHQGDHPDGARRSARSQQLLEASLALCVEWLQEPLRRCVGEFERKLFSLAERAHRADEQQDCFSSRQRVLQDGNNLQQRFIEQLSSSFNTIDTPVSDTEGAAPQNTWHSLELLDPAVQELSMSLDQLGARGDTRHAAVLYELGYRLAVLIAAPPLEGQALPLGPYALAKAFHEASAEFELPTPHQLLLLQHFDQWVIQPLGPLYDRLNLLLQSEGILPQLRSIPIPRNITKRARRKVDAVEPVEAAVANAATESTKSSSGGDSIAVLESLRDLLAQQRSGHDLNGLSTGRAASESELQTALGALQEHLAQVTDHASRELRTAARLREELLAQLNVGKPAGAPATQLSGEQGDTVELVAGLFEQLGQQLQQGGNARALLSDLQLPVLRMAVADKDFFEKSEHPARRLLDTVTSTAHDWLDGSDDETNRPLANKLEQLVNRASQEPPSAGLYTTLLADIEHHLGLLTRKAQAAERRHVEAAKGRERLDQARQRASELMAERFAQSPPRGLLRALLDRAWSDVLALTLLRHGEDSEAFRAQLNITDQLLGRLPTDDRPQLQQDVEAGLQQIGMHAEESVQVAQRLIGAGTPDSAVELPSATDLALRLKQHQRLGEHQQPAKPPVATPPVAKPAGEATKPPSMPARAQPRAPEPSPRDRRIEQHLRSLPFGSWFEFVDPSTGQISQRKLAWYSTMSGRCLLVSRRGQRGEEMTLTQLAHEIACGRVCEVQEQHESMMDRAWRGLTGMLRQKADDGRSTTPGAKR